MKCAPAFSPSLLSSSDERCFRFTLGRLTSLGSPDGLSCTSSVGLACRFDRGDGSAASSSIATSGTDRSLRGDAGSFSFRFKKNGGCSANAAPAALSRLAPKAGSPFAGAGSVAAGAALALVSIG